MSSVDASVQASLNQANIKQHFAGLFAKYSSLNEQLTNRIRKWQVDAEAYLQQHDPFECHRQLLADWQLKVNAGAPINSRMVQDFQLFCRDAGLPFDEKFWQLQIDKEAKNPNEAALASQLLCQDWQKKLDDAMVRWQAEQLSRMGKLLHDELTDWLNAVSNFVDRLAGKSAGMDKWLGSILAKLTGQNVQQMTKWCEALADMSQQLEALGLAPELWLDASLDDLNQAGLNTLQQWASVLANDVAAQKIADILGRMREAEWAEQISIVKQRIGVSTRVVDVNSREEIIGLRLGKDLEHALPSELALMADPDTAILFDLKYLESKLVCFELQGTTYQDDSVEIEVETKENVEEAKGPMILCIDTSASMQGEPEYMAKAMVLYLGTKAKAEERPCYVINFSHQIETFDLTGSKGILSLVAFLQRSFYGGTDAAPALNHALKMLENERYTKADVLMVSDFMMGNLPAQLRHEIEQQKQEGTRFNSLVIGDVFMSERLKTLFDKEWVYNPYTHHIHEVVSFAKEFGVANATN